MTHADVSGAVRTGLSQPDRWDPLDSDLVHHELSSWTWSRVAFGMHHMAAGQGVDKAAT